MDDSDDALIARHRAGDRGAFAELVRRYQRPIYFFALRMTGREEDARDLSQRAFIRAYQGLDRFEGRSSFSTWMHQIIANLCRNHHRDSSRARFVPLDEEGSPGGSAAAPTALSALVEGETHEALAEAVAQLPARQRAVLAARVYEDLSFNEIAEREGISAGNARVSFHHAVKALKASMAEKAREVAP